jgi:integrase
MRGDGTCEQRHRSKCLNHGAIGRNVDCDCPWRIGYFADGRRIREKAGKTEEAARKLLRKRLGELAGGRFIGPAEERIRVRDLLDSLSRNLELRGKLSTGAKSAISIVRRRFGDQRAVRMTATLIEHFQASCLAGERLESEARAAKPEGRRGSGRASDMPKAPATINQYVGVLRQAFRLAHKQNRLSRVPYFPMLEIDNARSGFLDPANFTKLITALPQDVGDATEFGYLTGWRKGQIAKLEWEHVDRTNGLLTVPSKIVKNRKSATIPLTGRLWAVIERRWERRTVKRKGKPDLLSQYVFHRGDGRRLGEFRKTWTLACRVAGFPERKRAGKAALPGLLFHDLRRSAARNLIRSGVDQAVAMKITGHKTESMFRRYNIIDTRDQESALVRLENYLDNALETRNLRRQ